MAFGICCRCLAHEREAVGCLRHPGFTVWPAWIYDPRAQAIVHALKYEDLPGVAESLGPELGRAAASIGEAELVLEVPLHPARQRERGYNQAAILADALAETMRVPRLRGALVRSRPTRAQARLDARARRANVRGAFRLERRIHVGGRRVVVVDDVMTTGATLEACLETLVAEGAMPAAVVLAWAQ